MHTGRVVNCMAHYVAMLVAREPAAVFNAAHYVVVLLVDVTRQG